MRSPRARRASALHRETMMRLADHDGDFRITMTPLFGLSWAFDEIWQKRRHDPRSRSSRWTPTENPHVNREAPAGGSSPRMTKEEREARQSTASSSTSPACSTPSFGEAHRPPRPSTSRTSRSSSASTPASTTGVVWVAFDNDNVALVFAELYPEQMVVEDVAKLIHAKSTSPGASTPTTT
jgi:hypothetical protein